MSLQYTGCKTLWFAMSVIRLQSIDPEKNRYREYCLTVGQDLFGAYYLMIRWGRIGGEGDCKQYLHESEEDAYGQASRIVKKRIKRGYSFTKDSRQV